MRTHVPQAPTLSSPPDDWSRGAKKILVVDDEERLVSLLQAYLAQHGFVVVAASNGVDALEVAYREKPDLIVLDLMMPELDGLGFMAQYRRDRETPIVLLTAKVDDDDKVLGLELGADDYVAKPFRPRELLARIRAVLRRRGEREPEVAVLRHRDLTLDRDGHRVMAGDRAIRLTPSEFELLAALLSSPGRVFSRLDLLDRIQGTAYEGYQRTIDYHIKNLRAKLGDAAEAPRYIETVYGVGYRLAAE